MVRPYVSSDGAQADGSVTLRSIGPPAPRRPLVAGLGARAVTSSRRLEAAAQGVSKNRRAIEALRRGMGMDQVERGALVEVIRRQRRTVHLDIAELIRADRPDDRR